MTANRFKFRAWDVKHNQMSDTFMIFDDKRIEAIHDKCLDENAEGLLVIMQSTGLTDKNGKEIFEGDIIAYDGEKIAVQEPKWFVCDAFMVHGYEELSSFRDDYTREDEPSRQCREGEIIGNIYENPELIKAR